MNPFWVFPEFLWLVACSPPMSETFLTDFGSFTPTEVCFIVLRTAGLDACFLCTWEQHAFCFCWLDRWTDVGQAAGDGAHVSVGCAAVLCACSGTRADRPAAVAPSPLPSAGVCASGDSAPCTLRSVLLSLACHPQSIPCGCGHRAFLW